MRALIRLFRDDEGQDLIEYALLVAFVGIAVLAAFLAFQDAIGNAYSGMDATEQGLGAVTPDPW